MMSRKTAEIEYPSKLDQAGKEWLGSKPYGSYNKRESINAFRDFSTILYLIDKHNPGAQKVLELGCGPGWLSIMLCKMGYECHGYDISDQMIKVANSRAANEQASAQFAVSDVESELIEPEVGRNDVVIIYDALHHCSSDEAVLQKAYKYLSKGGILIIAEPNIVHSQDADAREAVKMYGVTERGISARSLSKVMRRIGFNPVRRYHASGQNFTPRNETLRDTLKMLTFPLLTRFYYGNKRTRVWMVGLK